MKIEVGKSYKTKGGHKATILEDDRTGIPYRVEHNTSDGEYLYTLWHYTDGISNLSDTEDMIVSEWEETMEYKMWKDMTPEEKGALLLAHHEGKTIEWSYSLSNWIVDDDFNPKGPYVNLHYRIKPEPVVETRELYIYLDESDWFLTKVGEVSLVDGEPDWGSLKGETL